MTNEAYKHAQTSKSRKGLYATRIFYAQESGMTCSVTNDVDSRGPMQSGEHIFAHCAGEFYRLNHLFAPNRGLKTKGDGSYEVVARQRIEAGPHLMFDFAMHYYDLGKETHRRCGADGCRGAILGWIDLPAESKSEYWDLAATYLFALDSKCRGHD